MLINRHLVQFLARGLAQFQSMGGGMFLLARSRAQFASEFPVLYVTTSEVLQPSLRNFICINIKLLDLELLQTVVNSNLNGFHSHTV